MSSDRADSGSIRLSVEAVVKKPCDPACEYHEFVFIGETVVRDSLGRSNVNAWRTWLVLRCNNVDCGGVVLASELAVGEAVMAATR